MVAWEAILEVIVAIVGFGVAAELTAKGTDNLEPLIGQGMTGGVILGLLGSLPETLFVVIAMLSSSYSIALGSALGGNIILFTLGIGIVGIVYSFKWKKPIVLKEDYRVELYFLCASTAFLALLLVYGSLDRISGAILFALYFVYLGYRYANAHRRIVFHIGNKDTRRLLLTGLAYITVGALIVLLLAGIFVRTIGVLAGSIGVSALWLALVVSPLAADFGDNISANRIAMKNTGGGSTAIISFVGSKLQNNTMLLGLIGLLGVTAVSITGAQPEFIAVIIVNLIAIAVMIREKLTTIEATLLIITYFIMIVATFLI